MHVRCLTSKLFPGILSRLTVPMLAMAVVLIGLGTLGVRPAAAEGGAAAGGELCGPLGGVAPSMAQGRLYLPVYSSIRYLDDVKFLVAVTLSLRNPNPSHSLVIPSAQFFDDQGVRLADFMNGAHRVIPPLGTVEIFLRNIDYPEHSGASVVIAWAADAATASPPLAEAVMVGSKGSQGLAFSSRAIPLPGCDGVFSK